MKKILKYLSLIIVILSINQALAYQFPITQIVYYGIFLLIFLYMLTLSANISFNPIMIIFVFMILVSLFINQPPAIFRSEERFVSYLIIILLIGPLIKSSSLNNIREKTMATTNKIILFLVALSFPIYLLGISLPNTTTGFTGLFNHSMMLGPLAGIAFVLSLSKIYNWKIKKMNRSKIYYLLVLVLFSFFCLILAGSRGAILGAIGGLLFFFFKINKFRFSRFIMTIAFVSILLYISFPLWSDFTTRIQEKNQSSIELGGLTGSRQQNWESRIKEFKDNPFFGIGFAVLEIENEENLIDFSTGNIEPGSSWLAVLSMLGLCGFIPLVILFIRYLFILYTDKINILNSATMGAVLVIFIIHMFAEGYLLASGSYLFFYIWLLLGVLEVYKRNRNIQFI